MNACAKNSLAKGASNMIVMVPAKTPQRKMMRKMRSTTMATYFQSSRACTEEKNKSLFMSNSPISRYPFLEWSLSVVTVMNPLTFMIIPKSRDAVRCFFPIFFCKGWGGGLPRKGFDSHTLLAPMWFNRYVVIQYGNVMIYSKIRLAQLFLSLSVSFVDTGSNPTSDLSLACGLGVSVSTFTSCLSFRCERK